MTFVTSAHNSNGTRSGNGLPPVSSIPLTEDSPARDAEHQSLGALARDAMTHFSTLLRAEIELARAEITAEVKQGLRGSLFFVLALTLALLLLPFLLITGALGINKGLAHLGTWAVPWGGFAVVTLLMLVIAVLCALLGWRRVRRISGPKQTISSVRDTAAALKRHGESDQPH
jgi:hypothetical protein